MDKPEFSPLPFIVHPKVYADFMEHLTGEKYKGYNLGKKVEAQLNRKFKKLYEQGLKNER